MSYHSPPQDRDGFAIAIICALRSEAEAVEALFDEFWDDDGDKYGKAPRDPNAYTTGRLGNHNVVLAFMPGIGKSNAASVASSFRYSFGGIKLALVVGICGGVPRGTDEEEEILLGDVIISDGLVQYDFGKRLPDRFIRKDTLNDSLGRQNTEIRSFLAKLKTQRGRARLREKTSFYLIAQYPGIEEDKLYKPTYRHKHHNLQTCAICTKCKRKEDEVCGTALEYLCSELKCHENKLVQRRRLVRTANTEVATEQQKPIIHFGLIASGDTVIKSGIDRDEIAAKEKVIAFEMEGAGVWHNFPCVIIKAVCDYADSHKNKKWQGYAAATAAACMKAFLGEWVSDGKPSSGTATHMVYEGQWLVPFGRNEQFVGRNFELAELFAKLNPEANEDDCQRVAITGLGGVGKTQIALQVAFRIRKEFPDCSVFWVPAVDVTTFEAAYHEIALKLRVPGIDNDKADVKALVKASLSQESAGRWLLIIDNADDIEMLFKRTDKRDENSWTVALADYLPFSRKGAILFTTRNRKAAIKQAEVDIITVKEMSKIDSRRLLERSLIDETLVREKEATLELLDLLANLPLAIKQAAAFLNENEISISQYLEIYKSSDEELIELLDKDFEDKGRYKTNSTKNPIASTWLISFRQILNYDTLAAEYLFFMSCIAQQDIPLSLLPSASKRKTAEAIGTLTAYAFITPRKKQHSFDIHRLVQIAVRNWLKTNNEFDLCKQMIMERIIEVLPPFNYENRDECTIYIPHAQCILGFIDSSSDITEPLLGLLVNVKEYFYLTGNYKEAEQRSRQIVQIVSTKFSSDHPLTLAIKDDLVSVLHQLGKYKEAEKMQRHTLEVRKKVLGGDHPDTLDSMERIASILYSQGKYKASMTIYQQILELMETVLGIDHSTTQRSISKYALLLGKQGKFKEAENLHSQLLELRIEAFGRNDPATLVSMNNLAKVLYNQGKYEEAEEIQRRTVEMRKEMLGIDHPDTLTSTSNLALVLDKQGKNKEAEAMYQQTLELKKKVLGVEHPSTLISVDIIANVFYRQGKYEEAEAMKQQTLELRTKVLGVDHPHTLSSLNNLAKLRNVGIGSRI